MTSSRGRPRQVDISRHFCPNATCAYRGWVGWGNLSANGHPSGGPWRQWHCTVCGGYFLETHGTPFHGKRVAPDLLVWLVSTQERRSFPLRVEQVVRSAAEQAASKVKADAKKPKPSTDNRRPGRPKGRQHTPKAAITRTPELGRIADMLDALLKRIAGVVSLTY